MQCLSERPTIVGGVVAVSMVLAVMLIVVNGRDYSKVSRQSIIIMITAVTVVIIIVTIIMITIIIVFLERLSM